MIEEIYNYFTIEMLYYWVNLGVLPFWLILIFFPNLFMISGMCSGIVKTVEPGLDHDMQTGPNNLKPVFHEHCDLSRAHTPNLSG